MWYFLALQALLLSENVLSCSDIPDYLLIANIYLSLLAFPRRSHEIYLLVVALLAPGYLSFCLSFSYFASPSLIIFHLITPLFPSFPITPWFPLVHHPTLRFFPDFVSTWLFCLTFDQCCLLLLSLPLPSRASLVLTSPLLPTCRIVMSLSYTCIILRLADLKTERRQLTAFNPKSIDTSYGTRFDILTIIVVILAGVSKSFENQVFFIKVEFGILSFEKYVIWVVYNLLQKRL